MAERISQQKTSQHRIFDYLKLGDFIRRQNTKAPEASQLIESQARSLRIKPNHTNLQRAEEVAQRFSRPMIQRLLKLRFAGSDRCLSCDNFHALLGIDDDFALEHLAGEAVSLGLNDDQFRERINQSGCNKKSRRSGGGRRRRPFSSPDAALMSCRDQLKALSSALDDLENIEPKLTTGQNRHRESLKKTLQTASTALKSLADSCGVELEEPPVRRDIIADVLGPEILGG